MTYDMTDLQADGAQDTEKLARESPSPKDEPRTTHRVRWQRGKLLDRDAMCFEEGCDFSASRGVDGGESVAVSTRAKRHVRDTGHEVTVYTERAIYYSAVQP